MGHDHAHHHHHAAGGRRLGAALLLTLAFAVGEGAAGWWTNSLALLSDAGHNFADVLALALAWYAHRLSARRADARRTFGYHRVGVLAALANAVVLVLIALGILYEAWERARHPATLPGATIMAVAAAALVANLLASAWLSHGHAHDVNMRSARLHMLADAGSSVGVLLAGGIILATNWGLADPIASVLIGLLILWSSWRILEETVGVLLEAAPPGMRLEEVGAAIGAVPGVLSVHDLHVWSLGSGVIACSCHIVVIEQPASSGQDIQRAVTAALARFGITHTTVQLEVTSCSTPSQGMLCVDDHGHEHHDHDHDHGHEHHDHGHDHGHGHAHAH
jgi:cobalt-zinc-cadmium efflux system protein